jgi:putative membrane protein
VRAVRRRAEREFARHGIARTAGRTGVLLMLSAAERRAVLLADRAIHEKVAEGTWDAIVARVAGEVREKRAAAGLAAAVGEIGRVLAEHFPREKGDANELPDEVEETA